MTLFRHHDPYFDNENNILIASSLSDPQKSGSALKSSHTFGFPGLL
jgi:hypothetical protein